MESGTWTKKGGDSRPGGPGVRLPGGALRVLSLGGFALSEALGFLHVPKRENPGFDVGKSGLKPLAFVDGADFSFDARGASDGGEKGVTGEVEKCGGIDAPQALEDVLAGEKSEDGVSDPSEGAFLDGIGREGGWSGIGEHHGEVGRRGKRVQ